MKKIINILTILLLGQFASGQSNVTITLIEYLNGDKFHIDSLRSILGISNFNNGNWDISEELQKEMSIWNFFEREIDFHYSQFILEYQDQEDFSDYEVSIQYKDTFPIITIVTQKGLRKSKLLLKKVADGAVIFLMKYNDKYRTNFQINDINKDFLKPFEFGYACSVDGSPTDKFSEMMKAVNSKEIIKLKAWLRSPNINLRLFGAVGIQFLEYDGMKIPDMEKQLIKQLREKNYQVNSCSGCSPETKTVIQLMDDEWLKKYYESQRKRG